MGLNRDDLEPSGLSSGFSNTEALPGNRLVCLSLESVVGANKLGLEASSSFFPKSPPLRGFWSLVKSELPPEGKPTAATGLAWLVKRDPAFSL
jgi:hypothetical protein